MYRDLENRVIGRSKSLQVRPLWSRSYMIS